MPVFSAYGMLVISDLLFVTSDFLPLNRRTTDFSTMIFCKVHPGASRGQRFFGFD